MTSAVTRARAGLIEWMGDEPETTVEVQDQPFQVLLFDVGDDDGPMTYLATAGLSQKLPAELLLCVQLPCEIHSLLPLATALARTALALEPGSLTPPTLIQCGDLPVFEGMSWLLITGWGSDAHEVLPGTSPPIQVWTASPVFDNEAALIRDHHATDPLALFDEHDLDVDDPFRSAIGQEEEELTEWDLAQGMSQLVENIAATAVETLPELQKMFDQDGPELGDVADRTEVSLTEMELWPVEDDQLLPNGYHPGWRWGGF